MSTNSIAGDREKAKELDILNVLKRYTSLTAGEVKSELELDGYDIDSRTLYKMMQNLDDKGYIEVLDYDDEKGINSKTSVQYKRSTTIDIETFWELISGIYMSDVICEESKINSVQWLKRIAAEGGVVIQKKGALDGLPLGYDSSAYVYVPSQLPVTQNLKEINAAISSGDWIRLTLCGYDWLGKLKPISEDDEWEVFPYVIVYRQNKPYLYCRAQRVGSERAPFDTFLRIDLMSDVKHLTDKTKNCEISKESHKAQEIIRGSTERIKEELDRFLQEHQVSGGDVQKIKMHVRPKKGKDENWPRYTIVQERFGTWYAVNQEKEDGIIEVQTTAYAAERFALEYCDRVSILEPVELREKVKQDLLESLDEYK